MKTRYVWLVGGVGGVLVGAAASIPSWRFPLWDTNILLDLVVALLGFILLAIVDGFAVWHTRTRPFWKGLLLWLAVMGFGLLMILLAWQMSVSLFHWIHYGQIP